MNQEKRQMIAHATGWRALFVNRNQDGTTTHHEKPLIAWQENQDGEVYGLVLHGDRQVRPVDSYSNFAGYAFRGGAS